MRGVLWGGTSVKDTRLWQVPSNFMQRFWRLKTDPMSTSATYSFLNRNCGTHTATRYQPSRAILFWVKTPDGALARQTLAKCLKILNFSRFRKHLNFVSLHQSPSSTQSKPILWLSRHLINTRRRSSEDDARHPGPSSERTRSEVITGPDRTALVRRTPPTPNRWLWIWVGSQTGSDSARAGISDTHSAFAGARIYRRMPKDCGAKLDR
jgi:hypothetical protein